MVDSLIKICHINFFFKYNFFLIHRSHGWWQAGSHSLQLNSTFQPTSSHPTYRSNQPNTQGCSWIKYGHVYINSSSDLTLMDHFLFSLLLILHFYPPPPWIVAATLSQLHPTYIKSSNPLIKSTKYLRMLMDQVWSSFISTYHTTWLLRVRNVPTLC